VVLLVDRPDEASAQIDAAAVAEGRHRRTRRRVETEQSVPAVEKCTQLAVVAPRGETAMDEPGAIRRLTVFVRLRIEAPDLSTGVGVERDDAVVRRGEIEHVVDGERRRFERARTRAEPVERRFAGAPFPRGREPRHVRAVHVRERRIVRRGRIGGVVRPSDDRCAGSQRDDECFEHGALSLRIIMRGMRSKLLVFAAVAAFSSVALFSQSQTSGIRIHAATLLDGTGRIVRNATIVVEGSKIARVESGSSGPATYDLGTMTLVPGLIDVHSHIGWHFDKDGRFAARRGDPAEEILYSAENAYVTLMAGFTTIQSPGQPNDVPLRDAIARGILPGPRILTSIRQITENSGTPDELREKVRQLKKDGADVVKIFASASIRDGGKQTMTNAQLQAVCGEANALGMRTMVHAHSPESIKASVNAGCQQIEHGVFANDEVLTLMADKGVYFDPNVGVVLQNYLRNRDRYEGIGNYNAEGFAYMEKGLGLNKT